MPDASGAITESRISSTLPLPLHKSLAERTIIPLHSTNPTKRIFPPHTPQVVSENQQRGQSKVRRRNIGRIPLGILLIRTLAKVRARPHAKATTRVLAVINPVDPLSSLLWLCRGGDDV